VLSSTDGQLARAARSGSARAADELARRHAPTAWKVAYRLTGSRDLADEVSQEAFGRAFRGLGGFDVRRPFGPWLNAIIVNCARDALSRQRFTVDVDIDLLPAPDAGRETGLDLSRALASLSSDRQTIVVSHLAGYSVKQISEALDVPMGTAQSRLARALAELRKALKSEDVDRV
jgi:RNA polymerase sigma-70 factor (ECF subfamily)